MKTESKLLHNTEWNPVFDCIKLIANGDKKLALYAGMVLGRMWRYTQMSNYKICNASIDTLCEEIGVSYNTVTRAIALLENNCLIKDLNPMLKNHSHNYSVNEDEILKLHNKYKLARESTPQPVRSDKCVNRSCRTP